MVRDVDDVVQESLLRIWQSRARQTIRSAKDFLFQTGRNVATDMIRRERVSPIDFVADLGAVSTFETGPSTAEVACTREEVAVLADAIAALPARCREIVILRKIQRVPQKEIARRLGVSEFTVQNQVARGVKRCVEYLAACGIRSAVTRHTR
jgi:RNA polymerase sigma-70 factor (ECF subfamily)